MVLIEEVTKDLPTIVTLSPLSNKGFLVIWQWEWAEEDIYGSTLDSASTEESLQQKGELSTDSDLDDMLDIVCCKCVGVTTNKP